MKRIVLLVGLLCFGVQGYSATRPSVVDPSIRAAIGRDGQADVLLHLPSSFAPEKALSIANRASRLAYVYRGLADEAARTQAPLLAFLRSAGLEFRSFYIENAIVVYGVRQELLNQLALRPEIASITLDVKAKLDLPAVEKRLKAKDNGMPEHLSLIGADKVWNELGITGSGIVIASQDSGVYWEHSTLKSKYRGFRSLGKPVHDYNWHDSIRATNSPTPFDDIGHGTHTMGTMVGFDGGVNKIGVAPNAKWISCRNMNQDVGSVSTYLECFEFFLAPYKIGGDPKTDGRPEMAPHIVNNSWTCPPKEGCNGGELLGAVRALRSAGIFVVAAAGNGGPGCGTVVKAPAVYSGDIFSVGAYNRYYQDIADFSSWGPSAFNGGLAPNIVAPGESIRSAIPGGPNKYEEKAGTSMAAPQVAGVVALLWSAKPELIGQIDRTTEILQKTARPMTHKQDCPGFPGNTVPNATFGYGMLNAYDAVRSVQ